MAPLLARRQACDRTFERLYRRHAGDVYRYALGLLRDPSEAEDATQTAFLNAYRALVSGEEPRAPKAWLLTIVHNVCRMRRRALARRPREVPLEDHPIAAVEDERPRLDVVLAALAELPLNQRAALVMREVEGRSYKEIAEVLDVSTSAVEALIFRARRRLRVRRDALGALAAAPLPASLSSVPGGVLATGIGSDVVLKAAAGVIAALLASGAAYKAGTVANGATTAPSRKHAPAIRRVLLTKPESARPPARAERHARSAKVKTHRHESTKIVVVRRHPAPHRRRVERSNGIAKRHAVAPVSTRPAIPPTQPSRSSAAPTPPAPPPLPPVDLPPVQLPPVQLPAVPTTQLPTVTVPTPPPVPQVPDPPPPPKIP
jgi:RNA polymerase sigma-70 factor (ECF subfamily)